MQQTNYTTLADFFKLFYSVLIGVPVPSAEGTGWLLTQTDSSRLINCSNA